MTERSYYNIDTILKKKYKNLRREFFNIKKINICTYKINNSQNNNFLEYLLYVDNDNNLLYFPRFTYDVEELTKQKTVKSFIDIGEDKLYDIFKSIDNLKIIFNGYLIYNNEVFVFYKLVGNFYFINDKITKKSTFIFTTIHEIVNERKCLNFNILKMITKFFIDNPILIYLKDSNNNNIENPIVTYYGCEKTLVDFITLIGVKKQSNHEIFGPYYYFLTYEDVIRYAGWSSNFKQVKINNKIYTVNKYGKYKNGSIIRFALFLGNISVKLNLKNDIQDMSLFTYQLQKDSSLHHTIGNTSNNNLFKTNKISDRDGIWTKEFNSIYTSKNNLINNYIFTVNDINNAVFLTYQDIDNKKLPDKYDNKISTSQNLLL